MISPYPLCLPFTVHSLCMPAPISLNSSSYLSTCPSFLSYLLLTSFLTFLILLPSLSHFLIYPSFYSLQFSNLSCVPVPLTLPVILFLLNSLYASGPLPLPSPSPSLIFPLVPSPTHIFLAQRISKA